MKKILSIMLIMILALSLVACGKKEEEGDGKKKMKLAIVYTALGDFWDICGSADRIPDPFIVFLTLKVLIRTFEEQRIDSFKEALAERRGLLHIGKCQLRSSIIPSTILCRSVRTFNCSMSIVA